MIIGEDILYTTLDLEILETIKEALMKRVFP
jgi:hypothetical protein